jgi:phosphate transport system protein
MYEQTLRALLTYMLEDSRVIPRAVTLIFLAKHLERLGDHAANIAEMAVFLASGEDIRHSARFGPARA